MVNNNDIYINKKLNIQRIYTIKDHIEDLKILVDNNVRVLNFEGHTKINKIVSKSLKELYNYTGIIDDNLISNCPKLDTIYLRFNANSEINLSYDNNIKKVYFNNCGKIINLYNRKKNKILTKLLITNISPFHYKFYLEIEDNIEKRLILQHLFNGNLVELTPNKYLLKNITDKMIIENTLYIPDKYEYINIKNLYKYQVDRLSISNNITIFGDSKNYKQIKNICFKDMYLIKNFQFSKLTNLQYIEYLYNNKIVTIAIPEGYYNISNHTSIDVCTYLDFSNGYNEIRYYINKDIVTKVITINDNSEYYNLEKNSIIIPNEYDEVTINIKNLNNINLTINDHKKIPIIYIKNKLVINKLFVENDIINTIDNNYSIDINDKVNSIIQKDNQYILRNIHNDSIIINKLSLNVQKHIKGKTLKLSHKKL